MPLYEYECTICKHIREMVFPVNSFPTYVSCSKCTGDAKKVISKPQTMKPAWEPYYDEQLGAMVTGRRQREELKRLHGLEDKPLDKTKKRIKLEEREHIKREEAKYGKKR